ncbi:hypothetical protein K493DRAFT_384132 [Basidiobolus meristosporus CBS 931.73]|uniref:RNI-like protein n=1 Tax=Basidiobolus meristosporus CBS 931.73 TaxID=1314790 RepID=A0A1Y1YYS0_9FUNG|nr:hypothetical protein K493DRAFT_384132 [Basidiobolus meristosporus CBS 931.73]|eukprot:ORY03193.1 hypothetical protein K493DRAFT_384132 [Basidiobolus meristosporus CBS 931.73]
MGKEQLLNIPVGLYNAPSLALQLLRPESVAGLEPISKLPRTGVLNPSWFLNTRYDAHISGAECLEAVEQAMRILNGPVCMPKWRRLEKLHHKSNLAPNRRRPATPKPLIKWCCKIIAKDIHSYIYENRALIMALPLHLKERLLIQVSKLGEVNDETLRLFFDTGYQNLSLCKGHISSELLGAFFHNMRSSTIPTDLLHLNISYSNIQAPWFLPLLQRHLRKLTHLNISGCFDRLYGRKVLHEIASYLTNLQWLNISNVLWLTGSMMNECIDWSTQLPNLQVLVVENCPRVDTIYIQEQIQKVRPGIHIEI